MGMSTHTGILPTLRATGRAARHTLKLSHCLLGPPMDQLLFDGFGFASGLMRSSYLALTLMSKIPQQLRLLLGRCRLQPRQRRQQLQLQLRRQQTLRKMTPSAYGRTHQVAVFSVPHENRSLVAHAGILSCSLARQYIISRIQISTTVGTLKYVAYARQKLTHLQQTPRQALYRLHRQEATSGFASAHRGTQKTLAFRVQGTPPH